MKRCASWVAAVARPLRAGPGLAALRKGLAVFALLCICSAAGLASVGPQYLVASPGSPISLPDVSYNQALGKYLVVWQQEAGVGNWDIWGRIFTEDGLPATSAFFIANSSANERDPKAASADGDYWMVAYLVDLADGSHEVRACRIGESGGRTLYTVAASAQSLPHVDIGASVTSGEYLVVWDDVVGEGLSDIEGRMVDESDGPVGDPFLIETGLDSENPSINQRGNDFLVAWESHDESLPSVHILGRYVSGSGDLGDPVCVFPDCRAEGANADPSVASDLSDPEGFVVVWASLAEPAGTNYDIRYAVVSEGFVEPEGPVAATAASEVSPAVAYSDITDTFLVCYSKSSTILAQSLKATGVVGPSEVVAADPDVSDLHPEASAFFGGETSGIAVVWDRSTGAPLQRGLRSDPAAGVADTKLYAADWLPGASNIGLYDPGPGKFYLRNANAPGPANYTFAFGTPGLVAISGNWDLLSTETIGVYGHVAGVFYLRNSNSAGVPDVTFRFGPTGSTWIPIAGDWDADGIDTVGLYKPSTGVFYLKNANSAGVADITFRFGPAGSTWLPIAGDWDNDGVDTVGLYNPAAGVFYLRNANAPGPADMTFRYGPAASDWKPIAGDWDQDGEDSIGLYAPSAGTFYLRNTNDAGAADVRFRFGPTPVIWQPITGDWDGM